MRPIALALVLATAGCVAGASPGAENGTVDLRSWSVDRPLTLGGAWELYWQREPDGHPDRFLAPVQWGGVRLTDGRILPGQGIASYRIKVLVPDALKRRPQPLALVSDGANTAYRFSVTSLKGQPLVAPLEVGTVGSDAATSRGAYRRAALSFVAGDDFYLTLTVANFEALSGGPWTAPLLGPAERVDGLVRTRRDADFLALGLLAMMAIHHAAMFILRRSERGPLWLCLFTLDIAVRILVAQRYVGGILPHDSWLVWYRVACLSFYLGLPPFALFLQAVLPRYTSPRFVRASILTTIPFALAMLFLPPRWSAYTLSAYRLFTVVFTVWVVVVMIRATRGERDFLPKLMLAGVAPLALAVVNDVLFAQGLVQTAYIAHYGLSGFILFQSVLLAVANARARRHSESSAAEMATLNEELRRQIGDRSHRLAQTLTLLASDVRWAAELKPGTVMAQRYRIEYLLGSGGMGAVYAAVRLPDDKRVALKVVRMTASASILARFAREAEAAAKVNHPNVVAILDVEISDEGELFIVMERVSGRSLDAMRERFGDPIWAVPILQQLSGALEAIHAADVIHRDLKPANILVTDGGMVKVADFGIAGLGTGEPANEGDTVSKTAVERPSVRSQGGSSDVSLTEAGSVLGSPQYMSPEAQRGAEHTCAQSDLFSFGIVAYELLSGRRPFPDGWAAGPVHEPPAPLATFCSSVSPQVAETIDACLKADPRQRPQAATVRAVLAQAIVARSRVG